MPVSGSPKEIIHQEMHRFKHGQLHSGSHHGPIVKNRKQAIAIALSEAGKSRRADGGPLMPVLKPSYFRDRLRDEHGNIEDRRGNLGQSEMSRLHSVMAGMGLPYDHGDGPMRPGHLERDAGLYDIGSQHRQAGGQLNPQGLVSGLENAGVSQQMMPWAISAMAMPWAMGALQGFGQAAPQPQYTSDVAAPQGPAYDPGQAPVIPTDMVAPSIHMASLPSGGGQPAASSGNVSWPTSSFSGGKWAEVPGKAIGGQMTEPFNPHWMIRNEARGMLHSGPISSIVPGRTDRHNVHVASGSYVMPADAVSHIGQNNTKAGQAILGHMFGHQGPYGAGMMPMKHGAGPPKAAKAAAIPAPHIPKFQSEGGGKDSNTGEPVPVVVAGGEFTIPPEAVAAVGGGDLKRGHRLLDQWVLSLRKKHIETLRGLPPPAKS